MRFLFTASFMIALLVCPPGLRAQPPGKPHTEIRLIADVRSVRPGSSFHLGLVMKMDPGWHTYWKNAGEAGLPTQIRWSLPEGVTAGDILWPVPHKYVEEGDILTYGYEGENMLIVPMSVSADVAPGKALPIRADVEWLECELACIPGSGSVAVELPVGSGMSSEDNAAMFERYFARVPRPLSEEKRISLDVAARNGAVELTIRPVTGRLVSEPGNPDFYPEPFGDFELLKTTVHSSPEEAVLTIPVKIEGDGASPKEFRGVLIYGLAQGEKRAELVTVPLTDSLRSGLGLSGDVTGGSLFDRPFVVGGSTGGEQPLAVYLLFALVGGMLLNIMPCVLPVIGLKVFGLVRMGGEDPRKVRRLGWLFSLGILASFLVLALLVIGLKAAGEQVGWGFQFQEPVFVVVMSAVVMAFGLSLFGVFEVQLPSSAASGVSSLVARAGSGGGSGLGSFSEGIFATILATPCTAPILGTALGFAFAQPPPIILLMFTSVAFGMALPYLVLTLKPAWMKLLPRPGEWMVTAKQFMGFLMMATLLWLLYVLGKQLGMEAVIWTTAFLLTVALACWIIGRFATLTASRTKFAASWIGAILIVIGGWLWFQQPVLEARDIVAAGSSPADSEVDGIRWEAFSLPHLEGYLREGRAVFIDFTAEWCLTCKVNEKTVLADEDVIGRFRSGDLVSIRADWTTRNPDITRLLAKFGRSGVPLYVLFPKGRPNEPIVLPEVITSGIVIDAIDRAVKG